MGAALLALAPHSAASAERSERGPSLLFGGAIQPRKPPVRLDPVLPHGERRVLVGPWSTTERRLCSLKRPLCVDPGFGKQGLSLMERAYEEHTYGLSLPPPRAEFQEPLVFSSSSGGLQVTATLLFGRGFDRGQAHCQGRELTLSSARRCVSEAAVIARSPTTASWLRRGYAAHLARSLGSALEVSDALKQAAAHPELGRLTSSLGLEEFRTERPIAVSALRSAEFFEYLDAHSEAPFGHAGFLSLLLGASHTPPGALRLEAEPDLMDVLSATVDGDATKMARLMDDFAQYAYFSAAAQMSRGMSPPNFVDWEIAGTSLPRSLVLSRAMEPTGSVYVRLHLSPAQRGQLLAMQTNCEAPVSYVWSAVRLDERGQRLSALPIGYLERGTSVEARIEPMAGVSSLLFVGTNMGGIDLAHPFDPDHGPHESHSCRLYLSVLPPS